MKKFHPDGDLPECIQCYIKQFFELKELSNHASIEIRSEYREIWYEWLFRDKHYRKRASWSQYMNNKYGRDRMGRFYKLCQQRGNYKDFLEYDIHGLRAMLKLLSCDIVEMEAIHEWVVHVNMDGRGSPPPNKWVNWVSPRHFSEIILWRLVRGTK